MENIKLRYFTIVGTEDEIVASGLLPAGQFCFNNSGRGWTG